jgi:hypothetical protein
MFKKAITSKFAHKSYRVLNILFTLFAMPRIFLESLPSARNFGQMEASPNVLLGL